MKYFLKPKLQVTCLLTLLVCLSACGQKGPLEIEEVPVETPTTDETEQKTDK